MKTAFLVGGPLIVAIGFSFYSDLITFGEQHQGIVHFGGVESGGTFVIEHEETYRCDESGGNCVLVEENTEFSEIDGLEIEEQPIEYRNGIEPTTVRKLNGLNKYANITISRPTSFNWKSWRFMFEREAAIQEVKDEYDKKLKEIQAEDAAEQQEMIQIDPPTLVIPAH